MGFNLQLPHLAQGLDAFDVYKKGTEVADFWLERQKNAELAKIQKQTQDIDDSSTRFEKMIGLAKQSKRSKWLLDDINAMQSAQAQAELANRERMAGIDHKISETNKNNATATDTMAGVGNKRLSMLRPAHEILAQTGQTAQAMKYLDYARASGAIDDDTYKAVVDEFGAWAGLSPDEIKALGFAYAKGTLDPQYNWQTANNMADNERALATNRLDNQTRLQTNALDNETSRLNNALDNETSRYNNELDNQTERWKTTENNATERYKADQKTELEQWLANFNTDELYKEQQEALRNGTATVVTGEGGQMLVHFGGTNYRPYIGKDGKPAVASTQTGQAGSPADEKKRMEKLAMTTQDIENLIEQSTGSRIGNLVDWVGETVGYSTEGAQAIAQLKALSGQLVALQPKMSGPQSDKDVQLYREMAGDLANPNLPRATRLKALQTIRDLNAKYADHAGVDISKWQSGGGDGIQIQSSAFVD